MAEPVRTTCPYCGVGCGIVATAAPDGTVGIAGDAGHPANRGRLCSKGAALGDTLGLSGRLLHPVVGGRRTDWPTAIAAVARAFRDTVARHGPDAVAFYVSGQLLTEDYYVANKLMKGFIGSGNIDTNSRLCMASSVAGHRRAFGADTVPGCYEDLEQADLVVLVGSNLAWCHPVLYQRLLAARQERGTRVVVIDPRRTATCDAADLHLALRPGSDVVLFNGLLVHLARHGWMDPAFVGDHTVGVLEAVEAAFREAPTPERVAAVCDVAQDDLLRFYDWFAATPRTVTIYSQGVNQSAQGTDKVNAILNCHLYTGRIGRPGTGPFSVTGQPNAMGGREVGGLANQLAAHMSFEAPEDLDRVRRFWGAPNLATRPGLKAVDLFRAVAEGRVRALWIVATSPAVSLPEADLVRRALARCDFVAVSDCTADTDTARYAHVLLPATAWGEKDGTVTNSERRISRQRPFRPAPGEARPDWWIICQVARALGWTDAFPYRSPADIFREHAALSAFENDGRRDFDLGGLAGLSDAEYDALEPVQWPVRAGRQGTARLFATGGFFTPDRRARFVAVATRTPALPPDDAFPLLLNSGRLRDQWHTMTRTGRSARLAAHRPEPAVEVHPADAARLGLADGGLARIVTALGAATARVRVTADQRPGEIFLPMHWNDQFTGDCVAGRLIAGVTDPVSGQPELKRMPARLVPVVPGWSGFLIARRAHVPRGVLYWSRHAGAHCQIHELAGTGTPPSPEALAGLLPELAQGLATIDYVDGARGVVRRAWLDDDRLEAALFVSAAGASDLPRGWLVGLFGQDALDAGVRQVLLSGRAPAAADVPNEGRLVCACHGVGLNRIVAAIARGQDSVAALGATLKAGTNCGSCIPELKEILSHALRRNAA